MTPNAQEFHQAKQALGAARNAFDNADPEFIDSAVYQLTAAISRFDAVYSRLKKFCPDGLGKEAKRGKAC